MLPKAFDVRNLKMTLKICSGMVVSELSFIFTFYKERHSEILKNCQKWTYRECFQKVLVWKIWIWPWQYLPVYWFLSYYLFYHSTRKKNREDPKTGIANKSFEWEILISREYLTRFQVWPADYQWISLRNVQI